MIGEDLLQPCPALTALQSGEGKDVTNKFIDIGKSYNECRDSKALLINAARAPAQPAP